MKAPEENFEMVAMEEPEFEQEFFEEEIVMEMKEEVVKDNSMDTPMFASMPEEEIIEETNELISSFLPPPEEEPAMEEEMVDEEPTTILNKISDKNKYSMQLRIVLVRI